MWDTETGNIVWTNRHNGIITSCDISADSKYVVSVSDFDNAVKIWNAEDGKEAFSLKGILLEFLFAVLTVGSR